uniref:Uncharacterized protein n=1 Tax=Molossus molossus TaxID=27622 RepID=A0A7J8G081_MOLMO|nr:hypothetical protein HJG59_008159 [Molossus molossus]
MSRWGGWGGGAAGGPKRWLPVRLETCPGSRVMEVPAASTPCNCLLRGLEPSPAVDLSGRANGPVLLAPPVCPVLAWGPLRSLWEQPGGWHCGDPARAPELYPVSPGPRGLVPACAQRADSGSTPATEG